MIESGSAGKYFLYAVGEITLVVIGILIALQINNWNEHRKTQNQITLFLNNIVEDIDDDLDYLNQEANLHEFRINCLQYILEESDLPKSGNKQLPKLGNTYWEGDYPDTINRAFIEQCLIASTWDLNAEIQTGTIDEMNNLGAFSNIQNDTLKKAINRYYSFIHTRFAQKDWNRDLTIDWRKFWRDNFEIVLSEGISSLENPIDLIKDNRAVSIRINELVGPAIFRYRNVNIAVDLAEEVRRLIRDELEK